MSNSVSGRTGSSRAERRPRKDAPGKNASAKTAHAWPREGSGLYTSEGRRKYLNRAECERAMRAMAELDEDRALFALTLVWTGARLSEVLALSPASFQIEDAVVSFVTLKRRGSVIREVPIPPAFMRRLDACFGVAHAQRDLARGAARLWPWSRVTGWRIVKRVMARAGVEGRQACPKAFRHAFGIGTLQAAVPINLTQRWLGHARISTTAIYASACGPEERAFAQLFWNDRAGSHPRHVKGDGVNTASDGGRMANRGNGKERDGVVKGGVRRDGERMANRCVARGRILAATAPPKPAASSSAAYGAEPHAAPTL